MTSTENVSPSVVLVHGAYADGSSRSEVIKRLQAAGITATAVQNPLTSLADDVAHTHRVLALQPGPVVLAGHSFAGTVITQAGIHPNVAALVYIAARAPDVKAGLVRGLTAGSHDLPRATPVHGRTNARDDRRDRFRPPLAGHPPGRSDPADHGRRPDRLTEGRAEGGGSVTPGQAERRARGRPS